ncbi:MAG: EpsG family protein, partial [Clostridium sp.]
MAPFYATIISTYVFSLFSRAADEKNRKFFSIFFFSLVVIILILLSGLRSGVGDTYFYKHSFDILVKNPEKFKFDGDFALNLLSLVLMNISTNSQILIFTTALLTNVFNMIILYKYRSYLE